MILIRGHNHIELGRLGDCPGCKNQIPDQINPNAPEGCTYTFMDRGMEWDWVCNRHGFFASGYTIVNENSTIPCRAIQ